MKTLHTCKRAMVYAVVLSLFLSSSGPLVCGSPGDRNISRSRSMEDGLNSKQRRKINARLASLGMHSIRSIRENVPLRAPRTDILPTASEIVSPFDNATLKLIQECLCVIKNCVEQIKNTMIEPLDPSKLCIIDSKVDEIDLEVNLAVSKICLIDSKVDQLLIDFQETWTVIGANGDPVPTPNAILDVNTTTTYTVLQWLKAIYHKVK